MNKSILVLLLILSQYLVPGSLSSTPLIKVGIYNNDPLIFANDDNEAEENRESVDLALQALRLAKENVQLVEKRYKSGTFDVIEFNDAQLSLTRTRGELVLTYVSAIHLTPLQSIEFALGSYFSIERAAD